MPVLARVARTLGTVKAKVEAKRADHVLRHRPSGFRFAHSDALAFLNPAHWDALVEGHGVCLSRDFLELLEGHLPPNVRPHYALVYRDGRPVAAVAAQSVEVHGRDLPSGDRSTARKPLARLGLGAQDRALAGVRQRVLVCGNLFSWGPHGCAFALGEPPETLWPAVAEALYRIRRADRLFGQTDLVLVKDLTEAQPEAAASLRRFSYRPLETEPNMLLPLRPSWRDFEDYLKDMKSDYRSGLRKQIKDVEAAGYVLERLDADGVARRAGELHRLYLQVHDRQKLRLVTLEPTWLTALARHYGEAFRCTVLRHAATGALAGFVSSLRDGPGALGYYVGYDKAVANGGVPLYLRLLYALVEDAIALGADRVSLGRTALAPKAKLGAKPQAMRCFVRHRIPALNQVVAGLLGLVPEPEQAPERNPFKGGD